MADDRLQCLVPFCRRTLRPKRPDDNVGICSKHWSAIPKRQRAVYSRARRFDPLNHQRIGRLWSRLVRLARQSAMGI